jgi:hypothetical protein
MDGVMRWLRLALVLNVAWLGPGAGCGSSNPGEPDPEPPPADYAFVLAWGSYGNLGGEFIMPYAVAVAADGAVYVADALNARIQKFVPTR